MRPRLVVLVLAAVLAGCGSSKTTTETVTADHGADNAKAVKVHPTTLTHAELISRADAICTRINRFLTVTNGQAQKASSLPAAGRILKPEISHGNRATASLAALKPSPADRHAYAQFVDVERRLGTLTEQEQEALANDDRASVSAAVRLSDQAATRQHGITDALGFKSCGHS